jgi:hypothetical protein
MKVPGMTREPERTEDPRRSLVRIQQVVGIQGLAQTCQWLADQGGLLPGDYDVILAGTATPQTKGGLIQAQGDGEHAQVKAEPLFLVIYSVVGCEHHLDPDRCPDCRPAEKKESSATH